MCVCIYVQIKGLDSFNPSPGVIINFWYAIHILNTVMGDPFPIKDAFVLYP